MTDRRLIGCIVTALVVTEAIAIPVTAYFGLLWALALAPIYFAIGFVAAEVWSR